jgi:hypothetical protein
MYDVLARIRTGRICLVMREKNPFVIPMITLNNRQNGEQ